MQFSLLCSLSDLTCGVQREALFCVWRHKPVVNKKTDAVVNFLIQKTDFSGHEEHSKNCSCLTGMPARTVIYICGASPKQMNDINAMLERPITEDSLEYGISSLHAWIKTF